MPSHQVPKLARQNRPQSQDPNKECKMKISISGIYDRGNLAFERVHLCADETLDLFFFMMFDTTTAPGGLVSAGNHMGYWFAPVQVLRGEHIVVDTRTGNNNAENSE